MKKEQKSKSIIIDDLTVVSAKYGIRKGKTKKGKEFSSEDPVYQLSLAGDSIPYEEITAFDEQPESLTPGWFKDAEGYINLNSKFDIPVRRDGVDGYMSGWLENADTEGYGLVGSKVKVKITQKSGAIYPVALVVLKDGEPRDPFEDM